MAKAAEIALPTLQPGLTVDTKAFDADPLAGRVHAVLQQIRPAVVADGGDVELVDVLPDGTARVRFHGACVGCPSSNLTLHMGIERAVRAQVPEVARVIAVP
jgi:Fe-S cluster biogenesis protein NfuA